VIRTCDNGHPPARVPSGTRCAACERRRPSRQARGYDAAHNRARAALAAMLPAPCACECGAVLDAGSDWVAAHVVDGDPSAGWAAMCRPGNERMKRRGWRSTSDGVAPAGTRARLLALRPGFSPFFGRRSRSPTGATGRRSGPMTEMLATCAPERSRTRRYPPGVQAHSDR